MKKNNIFCVSESLVTAAPKPNWPFSKSSLVKIWWRQVFQQFQLLRALISTDLALRGSVEQIAIEFWKKWISTLSGCWRLKPQVGYLHSFLLEKPDNFCQTLTPRPISTFEGKKGEQKNRENNINTNKPQTQRISHTKGQNKQNTNNITQKKKLAVTWRRTGQDRLSICRAIN